VYLADLGTEQVVYKSYGEGARFEFDEYEFNRMDGIVAERLSSANRPVIVDIYGFCGLSQIAEPMPTGDLSMIATPLGAYRRPIAQIQLNDTERLDPMNTLKPSEKLLYALEMAESIALLHGHKGGVIVHDDIHLGQFLLKPDNHLKLNDFNRAEIMLWNEKDRDYCPYRNNPGHGDVSRFLPF
jgi:hypothetical protein